MAGDIHIHTAPCDGSAEHAAKQRVAAFYGIGSVAARWSWLRIVAIAG